MARVTATWIRRGGALQPVTFPHGAAPPAPEYDVVVGLIQSNMRGVATDYTTGDQYGPGVYMWSHAYQAIVPATEPLSSPETTVGMGAANTFLKDYAAAGLAEGRRLLVVNCARGGTGFTTPSTNAAGSGFHWRHDLADDADNLARRAVDAITAARAAAGSGARIVAYLANHGSTDGTNNTPKATFKAYLEDWIDWLRTTLGTPTVPYLMMQMRPSLRVESRHASIDDAQQEVTADPGSVNIGYAYSPNGSVYNKPDAVHFNAFGMRTIGHSLYDVYEAM